MHARAQRARRGDGRALLVALVVTVGLGMAVHGLETAMHGVRTIDQPVHGPMHDGSDITAMLPAMLSALCIAAVLAVALLRRPSLTSTLSIHTLRHTSAIRAVATDRPMSVHPPPDAGPFLRS